ncbi:MAG: iron export ABC transporter permease subunit FetB [Bacillota bacterium]|nr:iron export ABC transporter permease subunit FetB [Bacillota bacterium]
MDYNYIPISNLQLLLSVLLIFITGLVSALFKLGLLKSLLWGTVRAFFQLTLIGYALTFIFKNNQIYIIVPILLLMSFVASREASKRVERAPQRPLIISFVALTASTFVVGTLVVGLIIQPKPLFTAQVVIPIFGMILGNSMNGIALSLDRMYSEIHANVHQVEQLLIMGATPWEAVEEYMKRAVKAGMTPIINSLMVVGLVSVPGMMTGQILAGMNPRDAARYQFVVMVMIAAAVAIGCLIMVGLSYKKLFTEDMALVEAIRKN